MAAVNPSAAATPNFWGLVPLADDALRATEPFCLAAPKMLWRCCGSLVAKWPTLSAHYRAMPLCIPKLRYLRCIFWLLLQRPLPVLRYSGSMCDVPSEVPICRAQDLTDFQLDVQTPLPSSTRPAVACPGRTATFQTSKPKRTMECLTTQRCSAVRL